jgi:hypothetical protein
MDEQRMRMLDEVA